jgi:hypothetical protein
VTGDWCKPQVYVFDPGHPLALTRGGKERTDD